MTRLDPEPLSVIIYLLVKWEQWYLPDTKHFKSCIKVLRND